MKRVTRGWRVTRGCKGLLVVTWGYKVLLGVTKSYKRLQGVTGAEKGFQGDKEGYKGLHDVKNARYLVPRPYNCNLQFRWQEWSHKYSGICVSSWLGKVFCSILNQRLYMYLKDNNILHDSQIGFLPENRTADHVFTFLKHDYKTV